MRHHEKRLAWEAMRRRMREEHDARHHGGHAGRSFGPNAAICFVRAHLRRRLFAWFAVTILMTGLCVGAAMSFGGGGAAAWHQDVQRLRTYTGHAFADVWDDAKARDELTKTIQRDFDVSVTAADASGTSLSSAGGACEGARFNAPVEKAGRVVGNVTVCAARYASSPWRFALPLFVVGACLWGAAGAIARRLARPLGEVARVASEIGGGNLAARVKLGHQHHGEIGILACSINDMAERIEAHVAGQRQLLASVSHEMRTPLARIRLLTELGRSTSADAKTFDELDREVMEMDALVGDLLASSRMDFQVLSRRSIDVVEAAGRALERAGEDTGKLVVDSDTSAVSVDATLLARALANLIDNAKKHGGGLDALRVERHDGHLTVAAEDKGEGFREGEEARVFEPFFKRGDNGSLGLGLALVKRIAEAHRGSVFAENRPEGGARVGIDLPLDARIDEPVSEFAA